MPTLLAEGAQLALLGTGDPGLEQALGDVAAAHPGQRLRVYFQDESRFGQQETTTNVWALEVEPGAIFAYELRRPNRHFRVEFDLTRPVTPPPPPWGER